MTKGSQTEKIRAVMKGNYANMVSESTSKRINGALVGGVGGLILGSLFRQNAIMTGLIGAVIGYVVGNKTSSI
jgi:hypothetical protein